MTFLYDTYARDQARTWVGELRYGSRGIRSAFTNSDLQYELFGWTTRDSQYMAGAAPGTRSEVRAAMATALRSVAPGDLHRENRRWYVGVWFGPQDGIPSLRGTDLRRTITIPNPLTAAPLDLTFTAMVSEYDMALYHWYAVMTGSTAASTVDPVDPTLGEQLTALGLAFTPAEDGLSFAGTVSPTEELLESIPPTARPFAHLTVPLAPSRQNTSFWRINAETRDTELVRLGQGASAPIPLAQIRQLAPSGEELVRRARESYRIWLRSRWRSNSSEADLAALEAKRQHQAASKARFEAFRNAGKTEDKLIPTLPFVPHGLASSRRWGIEIESGGARGVEAPDGWTRKGDGSLRSAYSGYVEVQDFEPYDEEVADVLSWYDCTNYNRHMPHEQFFIEETGEYAFRVREDFIPVQECTECGNRIRTVRREPQTIHHTAQAGDCAEFVSPILVSMHSKGLESLLEGIKVQPQNATAGVHVHVEASDLNAEQIAVLVYGYDMVERFIEASYQREVRNYCKRRDARNVLELAQHLKNKSVTMNMHHNAERYLTTNTQALSAHGTIEFRAMGPVYDYEYLIRWAMFCREMVNVAAAGATAKEFGRIKKWEDLLALFAKYGKEYLRATVYEMTGETGEQAKLNKAGQPVTPEAVVADMQSVFDNLVQIMRDSSVSVDDLNARLTQPDGILASV